MYMLALLINDSIVKIFHYRWFPAQWKYSMHKIKPAEWKLNACVKANKQIEKTGWVNLQELS